MKRYVPDAAILESFTEKNTAIRVTLALERTGKRNMVQGRLSQLNHPALHRTHLERGTHTGKIRLVPEQDANNTTTPRPVGAYNIENVAACFSSMAIGASRLLHTNASMLYVPLAVGSQRVS